MNHVAHLGPSAFDAANSEVRSAVERTPRELIGTARSFEQHALILELAAARQRIQRDLRCENDNGIHQHADEACTMVDP